jgi:CRP/FNR family cyclic AMP-dependent transcriptional regulator
MALRHLRRDQDIHWQKSALMTSPERPSRNKPKRTLPPVPFLAQPGNGRTISRYDKNEVVFSQGDPADAVFYVQKGKLKITVVSERGKEAVEQPAFSQMFMTHILNRTIRVEADLIDQLFNSSERRLARLLLLLANYGSEGKPEPIITKISQETLAEMIGTTRSRVSFFMNRFRKLGFISYNGHIEVHKSLLNLVLHEQPHIKA